MFNGTVKPRGMRIWCQACGHTTTIGGKGKGKLTKERRKDAVTLMGLGFSIRGVCRLLQMGKDTARQIRKATEGSDE